MKNRPAIIGLIVGLSVLLIVYFFYSNESSNKYQWHDSFRADSKQPYGTMFIQKMLETRTKGSFTLNQKEPIHKLLGDRSKYEDGETDYVLVGQKLHLDDEDLAAITEFIQNGNDVFISTKDVPENLVNMIYDSDCSEDLGYTYTRQMTSEVNFYHPKLKRSTNYKFTYREGAEDSYYYWRTVDPEVLCSNDISLEPLGYEVSDKINFFRIPYYEGNLYIHTAPIVFTNYFMTKGDKVEYAGAVFSHLKGKNLIWDEVSKVPFSDLDNPYDSPLYYIMQQPALKYAWWMILAGALLYIIFASKRTQRIIPVLEAKTNTSLEFLNVISSLHYQNPNHLDIARKKMKYFLYFIRAKYGINTQSFTEENVKRLAERSKVNIADIQHIFDRYKVIENYQISNDETERLTGLYQAIETFYKNCK
jgi:hypothetical protein